MDPEAFAELLADEKASAILRTSDPDAAEPAMEAAIRGGFRVVEFTLTTPGAFDLIARFSAREELVVGAGTVLSPEEVREAVAAGARFVVSPVVDPEVIQEALRHGVAAMPGTHTPTEMLAAHRAGAQLQKVFPLIAGGAAGIRACLGPMPFLRLVPTNGVDENNVRDVLAAGAHAVGFVTPLFDPEEMAAGRWDRIEERARRLTTAARATREV
jgi:Entner-Doudoroff aldolase